MKLNRIRSQAMLAAGWILLPCIGIAQHDHLSLKHGMYVLDGVACKDAPFAAVMSWDGAAFSGPHSAKCTTHVLSHEGEKFSVSTTCAALGDGTPDNTGYVDAHSLIRLSGSSFQMLDDKQVKSAYRWCSAK